ncbi:restriction endonuclease subunit S, partial [Escherichia coli]|nr:restriction endonuclease subunit S [Escherichia coli]
YLGAIAIVPEKYNNYICSSGFALATSTKLPHVDIRYVLFFLTSKAGLLQLERRMTGGLYPAIVQEELEKIKIPIPSSEVQKEI